MFGCPSSRKIAIGADFDFLNFRVPIEECFKRGRLFEGKGLCFLPFLGGVNPAKRQPPFIRSPFQRQMGEGFDGCFINRQPVGFSFGRKAETVCFFAAGHLCLEGLSFGVSTPQERIPGSTGFIFSNEHGIVVIGAFIEYPGPNAGFDDLAADPAL